MPKPSLPQTLPEQDQTQRAFQLSLARTAYNYIRSYPHLDAVPVAAGVPPGEGFSLEYNSILAPVVEALSANFLRAVRAILERQIERDVPEGELMSIGKALAALQALDFTSKDWYQNDVTILKNAVTAVTVQLPDALRQLSHLPFDISKVVYGSERVSAEALKAGPTAFLKSTLFDMLSMVRLGDADPLLATSTADFSSLFMSLPKPEMLTLPEAGWMKPGQNQCEADWFFGYLQVAGFNTTNLQGVTPETPAHKGLGLAELKRKLGTYRDARGNEVNILQDVLRDVLQDPKITLEDAAQQGKLYVCDYAMLAPPVEGGSVHGRSRYVCAPIALFYWNDGKAPDNYPPDGYAGRPGVLQPIAIQLSQEPDRVNAPLFTPNDSRFASANDAKHFKWQIAKLVVNSACATQHESVAHLGECHLVMGTIVVAVHRQLAEAHPLFKLLWPHMRFTLPINDGALHNLVIPGGVVATNVGTTMSCTLDLINSAREAFRWDDAKPENDFAARAVTNPNIAFPFRDDTRLVWAAIEQFVSDYLGLYYKSSDDLAGDTELQAWINELVTADRGNIQGIKGAVLDPRLHRYRMTSLADLIQLVTQIIYTAGPKHAAVNFPQYDLGSYAPSVAAAIYALPPTQTQTLESAEDCLPWYLPLDVSLYALSFEYLLSSVQYDQLGHYDNSPRQPYFEDPEARDVVAAFQAQLANIEIQIRARNKLRPMPYPYQLPSRIPNSISI